MIKWFRMSRMRLHESSKERYRKFKPSDSFVFFNLFFSICFYFMRKIFFFYHLYLDIIKYGIYARTTNMEMKGSAPIITLAVLITVVFTSLITMMSSTAYAQAPSSGSDQASSKLIGAGLAFGLAGAGAGIGLGFVGAAGLAAISDNPKMQSRVFIFVGMVESIAIYGIVMMFIILGQK